MDCVRRCPEPDVGAVPFRSRQDMEAGEYPKMPTALGLLQPIPGYCTVPSMYSIDVQLTTYMDGLIKIILALLSNGSPYGLRGHLLVIQIILCCHQFPSVSPGD